MWRVCRALLPAADAEDAWAETFLAALRAYPRLRADSNVRGWLVTIAHRKAIDQLRGTARRARPEADLTQLGSALRSGGDAGRCDAVAAGVADPVEREDLLEALRALAPKQQACVVYRHLGDLAYAEIGRLLDISEAAARRNAADGIARLRRDPRLRSADGAAGGRRTAPPHPVSDHDPGSRR